MTFGMIYASGVFHWGDAERLLVGIFLTVFAVAGGLIGGWLDDLFGSKKAIVVTIGGNIVALFAAISITPTSMFFIEMEGLDKLVWDFPSSGTTSLNSRTCGSRYCSRCSSRPHTRTAARCSRGSRPKKK